MRRVVCLLLGGMLLASCSSSAKKNPETRVPSGPGMPVYVPRKDAHDKLIVTPDTGLVGKIVRVNNAARFVVINYPVGSLPGTDQRLGVYRQGLKVGEIRITGPQQDDNTVADLLSGEVQIGDETRAN